MIPPHRVGGADLHPTIARACWPDDPSVDWYAAAKKSIDPTLISPSVKQLVVNEHHEKACLKAAGHELFQERNILTCGEHLFRVLALARELELDRHSGFLVRTEEADVNLPFREPFWRESKV